MGSSEDEINQKVNLITVRKIKVTRFISLRRNPAIWKEMAKVSGKENDLSGKLLSEQAAPNSFNSNNSKEFPLPR